MSGVWRSLAACLNGVQEVEGSNPSTPTGNQLVDTERRQHRDRPRADPPSNSRSHPRVHEMRRCRISRAGSPRRRGVHSRSHRDRRPSPVEIALCTPWLDQEIALLRPRVILLLGGLAINRFWGKVSLEDAVGRSRVEDGVTYIPLPHPSGASRWLNDSAHRELLRKGLAQVRRAARALDREASAPTMRVPRRKKRGASLHARASKVRGLEEVITDMPKKKKAAKKKH